VTCFEIFEFFRDWVDGLVATSKSRAVTLDVVLVLSLEIRNHAFIPFPWRYGKPMKDLCQLQ
jgi:hypothetical protein